MDEIGKIKRSIRNLSGVTEGTIFTAQVKSVEGETCTIALGNASITGVRLRAVINGKDEKLYIKPKKDSYISVIDLSNGNYRDLLAFTYSEIEAINIKIAETTIDIDKNGVVFNGGNLNGMVKIDDLVGWMNSVYTDFQTLIGLLAAIPVDPATMTGTAAFVPATAKPVKFNFENTKIKQ